MPNIDTIEIEHYRAGKDFLLILTGVGGSTKGFENKYETIAKQVMKDYNFSVIVATTPRGSWDHLQYNIEFVMDYIKTEAKDKDYKVYIMGASLGANIALYFSYLFPQIKRVLVTNPILNANLHKTLDGIKNFIGEKISIVLGELDPASKFVELLPNNERLTTIILPSVDHNFKGHLLTYLDLPNKYLFKTKDF